MPVNECALLFPERIGDAARARNRPAAKIQRQAKPVVFRAVAFDQIDAVVPAEQPDAE